MYPQLETVVYELTDEARERIEESSECRLEELSEYRPKVVREEDAEAKERMLFWKAIFWCYNRSALAVELMLDISVLAFRYATLFIREF